MKLVFLLWLLYFLQGIPYGFQTKFLPVFLRSYSLSLTLIGFTHLLSLPWLLKPLWAPLVDKYGSKASWIKYNLLGMALCYLVASCMPLSSVRLIVIAVACLNVMAATEDIAVDSLFVNNFTPESIGIGNIAQIVGYKTGSLFGGGFLGWLSSSYSWQLLFFLLFVMYVISAILVSLSFFSNLIQLEVIQPKDTAKTKSENEISPSNKENPGGRHNIEHENRTKVPDNVKGKKSSTLEQSALVKQRKSSHRRAADEKIQSAKTEDFQFDDSLSQNSRHFIKEKLGTYLNIYQNVLKSEGTKWTIVYVLVYKLGEQGMISIIPMFLLDNGVSSSNTSMLTGVLCQVCSIFGSLVGGMLFSNWGGLQSTLTFLSTVRFIATILLTLGGSLNSLNSNWIGFIVFNCLLHLVSGMITTLTFSLMVVCSQKCPRIFSATHYSTLATFEVLGKLCMVSISGTVVDVIGYMNFFIICAGLTLFPIIVLRIGIRLHDDKVVVED